MLLLITGLIFSLAVPFLGLAMRNYGLFSRDSAVGTLFATFLMCAAIVWLYNSPNVQNAQLKMPTKDAEQPTQDLAKVLFPKVAKAQGQPAVNQQPVQPQLTEIKDAYSAQTRGLSGAVPVKAEQPLEPDFAADIEAHLANQNFRAALKSLRAITESSLELDAAKRDAWEQMALEMVRPLPASQRAKNYNGYKFLSALRPEETLYLAKIERYSR